MNSRRRLRLTPPAPSAAPPESALAPSEFAFALGRRPISSREVPPQGNEYSPPEQPTGVACGDSELLANILKGKAELAETVDRNEAVEPCVRGRARSELADKRQFTFRPLFGGTQDGINQVPRRFSLVLSEGAPERPTPPRHRKFDEILLCHVVSAMRSAGGLQAAIAHSYAQRLDVTSESARRFVELDHDDRLRSRFVHVPRFKVIRTCAKGDFIYRG
jgi:hypothetical protein